MNFPNLMWAISFRRLAHYEVSAQVGMEATRFSRCLRGRYNFTEREREAIATVLRYPRNWLFAHAKPPATGRLDNQNDEPVACPASAA